MSDRVDADADEGGVAPVVVVTRTVGGIVLVLLGAAMLLFGAFWFFLVPWFGWAAEGFWNAMTEWSDLGGAGVGILGFILLVLGGGLIQRARRRRLQFVVDVRPESDPAPSSPAAPPTIL